MPTPSRAFIKSVIGGIEKLLVEGGFRRRKEGIYTRDLTPDVIGWVGLNDATHRGDGKLWIHPMVGVRHQRVETEWSRLANERAHPYIPPTLVTNVGELSPRHSDKEWAFVEGRDNTHAVTELAKYVLTYAVPFMEHTTSLEAMRRNKDLMISEYVLFRLPLMYALDSDKDAALQTLSRDMKRVSRRRDEAAVEYRAFARRLRRELKG